MHSRVDRLHGCYENLESGSAADAMVDMTGGVTEWVDLCSANYDQGDERYELFKAAKKAYDRSALLSASINLPDEQLEACLDSGLGRR